MSPNDNIINMFPSGFLNDLLSYYLNCNGNDLIGTDVNLATTLTSTINVSIITLRNVVNPAPSGACNSALLSVSAEVNNLTPYLTDLQTYLSCPSVNKIWYEIINVGLCGDSFSGFFEIWLVIISTNTLLFVSMCIASVMFVQFDIKFEDPDVSEAEFVDESVNIEYVGAPSAPSHPGASHVQMVVVDSNKKAEYNLYGVVV
jgi:hypothetical protein